VGLTATPAFGQGAQSCTAIDNDAARLACYDRALRPTPPAAVAPAPAEPAAAPPPRAAAPVAGAARDEGIVPIVVVGIRALPGREATFTTEDGTRWVQTDSQRLVSLPDTPFDAEIKPGTMGSSFLVPKERGRAIRVRPVPDAQR